MGKQRLEHQGRRGGVDLKKSRQGGFVEVLQAFLGPNVACLVVQQANGVDHKVKRNGLASRAVKGSTQVSAALCSGDIALDRFQARRGGLKGGSADDGRLPQPWVGEQSIDDGATYASIAADDEGAIAVGKSVHIALLVRGGRLCSVKAG